MREGLRRSHPEQNRRGQAAPLRMESLGRILDALGATPTATDAHEVLALLVGHAGIMRPGELAGLTAGDLRYVLVAGAGAPVGGLTPPLTDIEYIRVTLKNPKTKKGGTQDVVLVRREDRYDTVGPLRALLAAKGAGDPLFTRTVHRKPSPKAMTPAILTAVLRKWLRRAGVDAKDTKLWSGHSGRRGGVVDLDDAGEPEAATRQGRWASKEGQDAYMGAAKRVRVEGLRRLQPVAEQHSAGGVDARGGGSVQGEGRQGPGVRRRQARG